MKKVLSVFLFLIVSFAGNQIFGEYAKVYGNILFYPFGDSSSIFRLDLFRGPPSYNSGAVTGLARLKDENIYEFLKDMLYELPLIRS